MSVPLIEVNIYSVFDYSVLWLPFTLLCIPVISLCIPINLNFSVLLMPVRWIKVKDYTKTQVASSLCEKVSDYPSPPWYINILVPVKNSKLKRIPLYRSGAQSHCINVLDTYGQPQQTPLNQHRQSKSAQDRSKTLNIGYLPIPWFWCATGIGL